MQYKQKRVHIRFVRLSVFWIMSGSLEQTVPRPNMGGKSSLNTIFKLEHLSPAFAQYFFF